MRWFDFAREGLFISGAAVETDSQWTVPADPSQGILQVFHGVTHSDILGEDYKEVVSGFVLNKYSV